MTREEIIRWFRKFRYDSEFQVKTKWVEGSHSVPIKCLAEFAGIPRGHLYEILRGKVGLSEQYQKRLTHAVEAVQAGLRWKRVKQKWIMINNTKYHPWPRQERGNESRAA